MYLLPKPYNGGTINNNENINPKKKNNSFFEPYVVPDIFYIYKALKIISPGDSMVYSFVGRSQRFRGICSLHLQGKVKLHKYTRGLNKDNAQTFT